MNVPPGPSPPGAPKRAHVDAVGPAVHRVRGCIAGALATSSGSITFTIFGRCSGFGIQDVNAG
jgi:hypothetical protein